MLQTPEYEESELSRNTQSLYDCSTRAIEAVAALLRPSAQYAERVQTLYEKYRDEETWEPKTITTHQLVRMRFAQEYQKLQVKLTLLENLLACNQDCQAFGYLYNLVEARMMCELFQEVGIIFYFMQKNPRHPTAMHYQKQIADKLTQELQRLIVDNTLTPYQPSNMMVRFSPILSPVPLSPVPGTISPTPTLRFLS